MSRRPALRPIPSEAGTSILRFDPPLYLFASLVAIIALHWLVPFVRVVSFPWNLMGVAPVVVGIALNLQADRAFQHHETSVKPIGDPTSLITTSVFRVSRNPMYLGFVLILLGTALLTGSASPFLIVVFFLLFLNSVFIRFEEKKLEQVFGNAWVDYRSNVRRWI